MISSFTPSHPNLILHFLSSDFVEEPVIGDEFLGPVWGTFTFETGEVVVLEGLFDGFAEGFFGSLRNR